MEIKPTKVDGEALVASVLDVLEQTKAWDCVTISSFDHAIVEEITRREPRVAVGALIFGSNDLPGPGWFGDHRVDAVHGPAASGPPIAGLPWLVYTVNDTSVGGIASQLSEARVTGLFTDDPERMTSLFALNRS